MAEEIIEKRIISICCPYLRYDNESDAYNEVLFSCSAPCIRGESPFLVFHDNQVTVREDDMNCPMGRQGEELCGLRITIPVTFAVDIDNEVPLKPLGSRKK